LIGDTKGRLRHIKAGNMEQKKPEHYVGLTGGDARIRLIEIRKILQGFKPEEGNVQFFTLSLQSSWPIRVRSVPFFDCVVGVIHTRNEQTASETKTRTLRGGHKIFEKEHRPVGASVFWDDPTHHGVVLHAVHPKK
jgi:hypothetical protein